MRKIVIAAMTLLVIASGACKKETDNRAAKPVNAGDVILPSGSTLPLIIPSGDNYILQEGGTYYLNGKTYVDDQARITINKGVTIRAFKKPTPVEASALIVTRGATIHALGDSANPITFTSAEAQPAVGDWGGVAILGRAQTNQNQLGGAPILEGVSLPTVPAGIDVTYGDASTAFNTQSSGIFRYVRILYAGAAIAEGNELNSLTLAGVGSGTEIHHVEAAYGLDDAFEFFGGTVNASYLVGLNPNDDIFDFDFGYTGRLQFVLGVRRGTGIGALYADANGIESDNNSQGNSLAPLTQAKISNMTLISGTATAALAGTLNGARLRRATNYDIRNSVLLGYNNGVSLEGGAAAYTANFRHNYVHGFTTVVTGGTLPSDNVILTGSNPQVTFGISSPFAVGLAFRPFPVQTSPLGCCADFTGTTGFTSVVYKGAFPVNSKAWLNTWTIGL
jgi:hypothetical protein